MPTLNVIVPAYNEEDNIAETVKALQELRDKIPMAYRIIVVNDRSEDKTQEIVEQLLATYKNLILVNRKGNHGLGRCINRGLEELKEGYVVIVMADLADDIEDIPRMLQVLDKGYDLVCGSRYTRGGDANHDLKIKGILSFLLGRCLHWFTGLPTVDATNAYKMYRTHILEQVGILRSDNYASGMEVTMKAYVHGFRVTEIPTIWRDRSFGSSHFRIFKAAPEYLKWTTWGFFKIWLSRLGIKP
jgi:dolichol-phosphate mannosyltransferase